MAAEIIVDLELNDDNFKKDLRATEKTARKSGERVGDGITKPVKSSFNEIANIAKGFVVGSVLLQLPRLLSSAFTTVTSAAIAQEDAVNDLNAALKRTGGFSEGASKDLQRFASALQGQSIIGDEVILKQIAYAKSLGLSNEQTKEFVSAALNASAALDKDFNGTLVQLLKTLSGVTGEVKELVPQIGTLTVEQLKAGGAAKLFNDQFAGAARAQVNTTSGSITQLSNTFGDFTEKLGAFIIESKSSQSSIRQLTQIFNRFNLSLSGDTADAAKAARIEYSQLSVEAIKLRKQISETRDPTQLRTLEERLSFVRDDSIKAAAAYKKLTDEIIKPIDLPTKIKILSDSDIAAAIGQFKLIGLSQVEQIRLTEAEQTTALDKARSLRNDDILSEESYQARLAEVKRTAREAEKAITDQAKIEFQTSQEEVRQSILDSAFSFETFGAASSTVFADLAKEATVTSRDVGNALVKGIGVGAGNAFAAFGAAVANGENALGAFAEALFKSIASQAVALGTNFLLSGTAMLFSPNPEDNAKAPFLIKSGAALAAFGGFLGASAGGGGAPQTSGAGAPVSGGFEPQAGLSTDFATEEREEASTRVTLNIQGDILDSEETGLRIATILENASLNENVRVLGGLA